MPDLDRFLTAQETTYAQALAEIQSGKKRTHWMWFIFPQIAGLGHSETSRFYAIKDITEAEAYLAHDTLGPRLRRCMQAVLAIDGKSAHEIFGDPDDMKLHSSATLFAQVAEANSIFEKVLQKYYNGNADGKTLTILREKSE